MLRGVVLSLIFVSVLAFRTGGAIAADVEQAPSTQPVPTTQSAEVAAAAAAAAVAAIEDQQERTLAEVFRESKVGELFEGKRKVSLDDVRSPVFWIDTIRDLAVTIASFIPRIIVAMLFIVIFYGIYRAAS